MDPFGSNTRLIDLAYDMAKAEGTSESDLLRRFRVIYRHLATSVTSVSVELGQGPYGPMGGMPGMQMPDAAKLMADTDAKLSDLS
jgi:hypothetical protein